jgi:c-di-GMP-binding flagellar brake protein YcgR
MISEGGMLLRSAAPLRRGQEIDIHFYLPNGEFIDAGAKIIYNIKEPDAILVGVVFTALTARHQKSIQEYVDKH